MYRTKGTSVIGHNRTPHAAAGYGERLRKSIFHRDFRRRGHTERDAGGGPLRNAFENIWWRTRFCLLTRERQRKATKQKGLHCRVSVATKRFERENRQRQRRQSVRTRRRRKMTGGGVGRRPTGRTSWRNRDGQRNTRRFLFLVTETTVCVSGRREKKNIVARFVFRINDDLIIHGYF